MISKTLSVSQRFNTIRELPDVSAEFAQLLFTLLLPHTDDFGRMSGDPFSIKMTVLPASLRPIEHFAAALESLHIVKLIELYEADSAIYLQISKFEEHQSGLHKRTESKIPVPSGNFPELPGNSRSRARAELNLTERKGTEGKRTEENLTQGSINKLVSKGAPHTTSNGNGKNGAHVPDHIQHQRTPIIGRNPHIGHAACDDGLSYCVPAAVHHKLADLLAPKHGGNREEAKSALQTWYPSVWKSLPIGTVMGDSFKFWQAQFDRSFASDTPRQSKSEAITAANVEAGKRVIARITGRA